MNEKIKEFISKYEICDAHGHIFPEKIADKAVSAIGHFYDIDMTGHGNTDAIIESGKTIGVTHQLVCSTATVPHQVESINRFIAEECSKHPEFIGFGSLHPDYDDPDGQAKFCIENGICGLKLHPDFQEFLIDDKKAYPMYEAAQSKNLPILFHTGDNRYPYSSPKRLKKVLKDFPNLKVFAAHFGGYRQWDEAAEHLAGEKNVYFDTSSSLMFITTKQAKDFINAYGAEKMFFGSDFPMWTHDDEIERLMALNLTDEQNKAILSGNFKAFFNIK